MKADIFIFLMILSTFNVNVFAQTQEAPLPHEIRQQMNLMVTQGTCQEEFAANSPEIRKFIVEENVQTLYAVSCSVWAHNQAWAFFLAIQRDGKSDLIKPLFFIRHSSYKGLYADNVAENISWDTKENILTSRKYLNGKEHCGELAGYQWNVAHQDFTVISILKNDDCSKPDAEWTSALSK